LWVAEGTDALRKSGKTARNGIAALVLASVLSVFADASDALIAFSTKPPSGDFHGDTYADGTRVLDGEWYALVWSSDGVFDGITTDCRPVDANDRVLIVAPLASGGHCPYVIFQVDSRAAECSGEYAVFLLDTRSADGRSVAARTAEGKPALLNGAAVTTSYVATAALSGGATVRSSVEERAWDESVVADPKQPTITSFRVEGGRVTIQVGDVLPGVKYNVSMGVTPDRLEKFALSVPLMANDGKTVFNLDRPSGNFFRVVREPLARGTGENQL